MAGNKRQRMPLGCEFRSNCSADSATGAGDNDQYFIMRALADGFRGLLLATRQNEHVK